MMFYGLRTVLQIAPEWSCLKDLFSSNAVLLRFLLMWTIAEIGRIFSALVSLIHSLHYLPFICIVTFIMFSCFSVPVHCIIDAVNCAPSSLVRKRWQKFFTSLPLPFIESCLSVRTVLQLILEGILWNLLVLWVGYAVMRVYLLHFMSRTTLLACPPSTSESFGVPPSLFLSSFYLHAKCDHFRCWSRPFNSIVHSPR